MNCVARSTDPGRQWWLLPALLLCFAAGCQGKGQVGSTNGAGGGGRNEDLSPADAAGVCLATARRLEQSGYEAEAIVQYERARTFDPSCSAEAGSRLAVLYDRQGQDARAAVEYEKALRLRPGDARLLNDVGYFHASRGDAVQAESWFRAAIKADPTYQRAWVNLATALARQRRYDESLTAFSKALRPAEAKANVGTLMAQQGEYQRAALALRQAIALDPSLSQPRAVLRWVESKASPAPQGVGQLR